MTTEEIIKESLKRFPIRHKENKKGTGEYDSNFPRRKAFIEGACFSSGIDVSDIGYFKH